MIAPDKQRMIDDVHVAYNRLFMLADSMKFVPRVNQSLVDESIQHLFKVADCLERALPQEYLVNE